MPSSLNRKIEQLDDILLSLSHSIESLNLDTKKKTPARSDSILLFSKQEKLQEETEEEEDASQKTDASISTSSATRKELDAGSEDRRSRLALLAKWKAERDAKRALQQQQQDGSGVDMDVNTNTNVDSDADSLDSNPKASNSNPNASIRHSTPLQFKHLPSKGWEYNESNKAEREGWILFPEPKSQELSAASLSSASIHRLNASSLRIQFYFPPFSYSSHFSNQRTMPSLEKTEDLAHFSHFPNYTSPPFPQIQLETLAPIHKKKKKEKKSQKKEKKATPVSSCHFFRVGIQWTVGQLIERLVNNGVLAGGRAGDWALIERLVAQPKHQDCDPEGLEEFKSLGLERRLRAQESFLDLLESGQIAQLFFIKAANEAKGHAQALASASYRHPMPFSFWTHVHHPTLWPGKWKQRWIQMDSQDTISCYKKEKVRGICLCILGHFFLYFHLSFSLFF